MGTGTTLSERFKGLNPWKLSSLEDEFEQQLNSSLSLTDVLKLSSLAVTVNGKSKSGHPNVASTKNYATTSLHSLFSQKSTEKKEKFEKVAISKDVAVDQKKKMVNATNAEKLNSKKWEEVPEKEGIRGRPSKGKAPTDGSKETKPKPSKGSAELHQNGVKPSVTDRPRDPRLLYGKGPYNVNAKKPEPQPQQNKNENPIRKLKNFGESLTSANRTGLEAAGTKTDGDKTIQVVKRNAVTKKITGIMQMNAKRKPFQKTEQSKPTVTDYHSSHNALKKIADAQKTDSATDGDLSSAAVETPQVLKSILKKDVPIDSVETNENVKRMDKLSTTASAGNGNEKNTKTKKAVIKQKVDPKKPVTSKVKGPSKIVKPKLGIKKKMVPRIPSQPNIVLKLSITPSIDNGQLNLTVVSSSEDDLVKSDSNDQNGQVNIPLSIESNPQAVSLPKDEARQLENPKQTPITDEELKKGSPIQVRISNGINGHTPRSSACMTTLEDASSKVENISLSCVGPDRTRTEPHSPVVTSGCVYTTAGKAAQVSTHQSVVKLNNRPPIPISYVFGTAVNSNKEEPVSSQKDKMPYQSGHTIDATRVQHTSTIDQYVTPQKCHQGNKVWSHNQPGKVTQPIAQLAASSIPQSSAHDTLTQSTPSEVHKGNTLLAVPKEDSKPQNTVGNMPITVHIQQNGSKAKKVIYKETTCKPVHRTLTAIARATEDEKTPSIEADNLDVIDMDISTPTQNLPNSIEGMSVDRNVVPTKIDESAMIVPPSVESVEEKNITNGIKDSRSASKVESEVICSSGGSYEEGNSKELDQQIQTASWKTYLHEDTNSPMKSAFGSKQSFTEALSLLQKTMQTSSESADLELSKKEATTPSKVISSPTDPSPSNHLQPTSQMDTSEKIMLTCKPTESSIPESANPLSEDNPKGSTLPCGSDALTAIPDANHKINNSVQDTLRMEIPVSVNVDSVNYHPGIVKVTDGISAASVPKAIGSVESVNIDKQEPGNKKVEVLQDAGMDGNHVPANIIIKNSYIFEDTSVRSKSPGTPVEDECLDQDLFVPIKSINQEVESRLEDFVSSDNQRGISFGHEEETNNNICNEKEIDSHHQHVNDQLDFPRRHGKGINQYPHSPRNRPAGPFYLRQLSNVSDISMGDDEFATFDDEYQEAVEPLVVRGSAGDSRGIDDLNYPRDGPIVSRRETCTDERFYSDRNMSIHSHNETDSCFPKPAPRIDGYDNEKSDYPHPYPEERDFNYVEPNRPIHKYREKPNPNSQMYVRSDVVPDPRDGGRPFEGTPGYPMIREQMTAVQALQLQINAAINPAHRAALLMALQALTQVPGQSSGGEVQPDSKTSTVSDRQPDFRDMADDGSSRQLRNGSVREGPSPRKVEFTVVLRGDEEEQLFRKDSSKRSTCRTETNSKVHRRRHSYDAEERYPDSYPDSHYSRNIEYNRGPRAEHQKQEGIKKERIESHERNFTVKRSNSKPDSDGERHSSRDRQSFTPDRQPTKPKKSTSKKSKKKAKEFHGRPLIKDKTNKTDPHSIPLESEDVVHKRDDPRRSLTPDPVYAPKELRPLSWHQTPEGGSKAMSAGKDKKLKHTEKKRKENPHVPSAKNRNSKEEGEEGGLLKTESYADTLVEGSAKEGMTENIVHLKEICHEGGTLSDDGMDRVHVQEVSSEITHKPGHSVEQTIEAFVTEARLASKHDVDNREQNGNIAGEGFTSVENIRNDQESEDKCLLDTSRECVTPSKSPVGGKKKSKSPESRKYNQSDNEDGRSVSTITPQKRKLSDRSPERHRKHRHSESKREKTRYERKFSSDSESDIDSDREHARESGSKLKRFGHFSRFTKGQDWRSARNGPLRHGFAMRHRTPFKRFNHKKYIYPGNLGKPYGNQKTNSSFRGRGRGGFRGVPSFQTPWRNKDNLFDITKEVANSPSVSMAKLGYKDIERWQDVHADLYEIKSKMLGVENSSREVRKASSLLQVAPLLKVHRSALKALQCIFKEVSGKNSYARREMYLHRRKYEILMADIRIHAEVLGKLIPPDQEEEMLSKFEPNTTGIPGVQPSVELKIMNWLRPMNSSRMLRACKDVLYKKIRSLTQRIDVLRSTEKKVPRRREDRAAHKKRQWSGSDRSPDTTNPDHGYRRDADETKYDVSPEVLSCPEYGVRTPEVSPKLEPSSEIRLPTHLHMAYTQGYPQPGPSTAFRDPPDPVRHLICSSHDNLGLVNISMPLDKADNKSFNLIDIPMNECQLQAEIEQCVKPVSHTSTEVATGFTVADSSTADAKGTQVTQVLSPESSFVPQVPCDVGTPPTSSSGISPFKPATPSVTYPMQFYISRVHRLASRTLMSPESGSDVQTLLNCEVEKSLKRSKSQRSPSTSEEPSSQGDSKVLSPGIGKCDPKSPRYSKKRHFLAKFQSDTCGGTPKEDVPKQCKSAELVPIRMTKKTLNLMYDEYDESCLEEETANVDTNGHDSSPSSH